MSEGPANPKTFRLHPGDAFGFDDDGERVAVAWPEVGAATDPREAFEDTLLDLGLPFAEATAAGAIFDKHLAAQSASLAAEKLRDILARMAQTKVGKSIEYLAILKVFSPHRTLEDIAAGTGHSRQKLHYQARRMERLFLHDPH